MHWSAPALASASAVHDGAAAGTSLRATILAGAGALAVAAVGGVVGSVLTNRASLRRHRSSAVREDTSHALDALGALRDAYRRRARDTGGAPDDTALQAVEDVFDLAMLRVGNAVVLAAARAYVDIGRLYAARDPDTGDGAEREAYQDLANALVGERAAYG